MINFLKTNLGLSGLASKQLELMDQIKKFSEPYERLHKLVNPYQHIFQQQAKFGADNLKLHSAPIKTLSDIVIQNPLKMYDNFLPRIPELGLMDVFRLATDRQLQIEDNPELHYCLLFDLELLNLKSTEDFVNSLTYNLPDDKLTDKEELLAKNLLPYLRKYNFETMWLGAEHALSTQNNPDKLRQCLISIRTLYENIIENLLVPISLLRNEEAFKKFFKKLESGKEELSDVKIPRKLRIDFFTQKYQFGIMDEFTKQDIDYVGNCYSVLCNVHQVDVGLSENQVRCLKLKTGVIIWLLLHLYELE